MTDHDDKVTRRYRELARAEPPAALDAAILAASRRAVARPSAASRWGPPLSIAAVLMLAVGVTLNMQREQPGVEYAEPARPSAPADARAPEPAAPVPQMAPKEQKPPSKSLQRSDPQQALRAQKVAPSAGIRQENFVQSPPAPKIAAEPAQPAVEEKLKKDNVLADLAAQRPEPRAFSEAPAASPAPASPAGRTAPAASIAIRTAPPPPPAASPSPPAAASAPSVATVARSRDAAEARTAETAQAMPAEPAGAKREADAMGTTSARVKAVIIDPTVQELERIARLRAEGRHAEADKALEEFRRRHPGLRIPDAMWERVKAKGEGEQPPSTPR